MSKRKYNYRNFTGKRTENQPIVDDQSKVDFFIDLANNRIKMRETTPGQYARYTYMTPQQARALAAELNVAADCFDRMTPRGWQKGGQIHMQALSH